MQPLPYLMHIIKTGVNDAGFTLAGDILTDADLQQALPFRDGSITFKLQSRNCHWHIKTINMMH
jgi:hypothetical protein